MDNIKEHLPLFGVGPIIVYGQLVFTAISIILTIFFDIKNKNRVVKNSIYNYGNNLYSIWFLSGSKC